MNNNVKKVVFLSMDESVYLTAKLSRGETPSYPLSTLSVNSLVGRVISMGHLACTEQFTCFIQREEFEAVFNASIYSPLVYQNPWLQLTDDKLFVMCNPRFAIEFFMNHDKDTYNEAYLKMKDLYPMVAGYEKEVRQTYFIETNIGCTREMNRHRGLSPLEQSTRYLTMTKKDFNFTSDFVQKDFNVLVDNYTKQSFLETYQNNIEEFGRDEARDMLPLGTVTKVFYTGFPKAWNHFFGLRRNPKTTHPMIRDLADKIYLLTKEEN